MEGLGSSILSDGKAGYPLIMHDSLDKYSKTCNLISPMEKELFSIRFLCE